MTAAPVRKFAVQCPGDRAALDRADPVQSRSAAMFEAHVAAGVNAEPAMYCDDFGDEMTLQLRSVHVLCKINVSTVSPFPPASIDASGERSEGAALG